MPNPTHTASEYISDKEIADIYKEADKESPPAQDIEENSDDASHPAEPKEVLDEQPPETKDIKDRAAKVGLAEGATEEEIAAKEQEAHAAQAATEKDLKDRAVKAGLPETATKEEVESKEAQAALEAEPTDKEVQDHAVKHSLTPAEAKADIMATRAVLKNYKTPEEMARALRSKDSEYSKLKKEQDKKNAQPLFVRMTDEQFLGQAQDHFSKEKDKHVEAFRQRFPAKGGEMSDDAIIEELSMLSLGGYKKFAEGKEGELKTKASKAREDALASIAEEDRALIPEVKTIMDKTSDREVLHEAFDIEDLVRHARGEKTRVKSALKAEYDRGFKAGRENPVIAGAKGAGSGNPPAKKPAANAGGDLSQSQKDRAIEMFPHDTHEKAFQLFRETYADDLKKNKEFVY